LVEDDPHNFRDNHWPPMIAGQAETKEQTSNRWADEVFSKELPETEATQARNARLSN
jgi:hypothetical protein